MTALSSAQYLAVGSLVNKSNAVGRTTWREWVVLLSIFLLYTNAAVVAVQFHDAPAVAPIIVVGLPGLPLLYDLACRRPLIVHSVLPWVAGFVIVQLLSTACARRPDVAIATVGDTVLEGLVLFLLFSNTMRSRGTLNCAIWTLLAAGAAMGGLTLFQQLTWTHDNNYGGFAQMSAAAFTTNELDPEGPLEQPRMAGPIGEQNRYAQILQMLIPLGICQAMAQRGHLLRWLSAGATVLITFGMVLTFSRGAAVSMVVLLILAGILLRFRLSYVLGTAVVAAALVVMVPQFWQRVQSLEVVADAMTGEARVDEADGSVKSRLTAMMAAGMVFLENPLLGVGPGMFRYYYRDYAAEVGIKLKASNRRAHCLYLEIAADTGVLGIGCFLAILATMMWHLIQTRNLCRYRDPCLSLQSTGLLLALVSYMGTGFFLHFAYIRFFWFMLALAAAATHVGQKYAAVPHHPARQQHGPH